MEETSRKVLKTKAKKGALVFENNDRGGNGGQFVTQEKGKRRMTRQGREACARAGTENLRRYREGIVAESTAQARNKIAAFEKSLRAEFPDPPAIVTALIESAVASFSSLIFASFKQLLGSTRIDRLERVHGIVIESGRVLFRTIQALAAYADTPEARKTLLKRLSEPESIPRHELTPEEKAKKEATQKAWSDFFNGVTSEPPIE